MKSKKSELIIAIEAGDLDKTVQQNLEKHFKPFFDQALEWKAKTMELVVTDETQTELMESAREGRLFLKSIRVEANKERMRLKEDSLREGRTIQGVFNVIADLITPLESHLLEQEQFAERLEAERTNKLRAERALSVESYREFHFAGIDLAEILEEDFHKLLNSYEAQARTKAEEAEKAIKEEQAKLEAIKKKAEAEKKAREETRERLEAENKKLREENIKTDKRRQAEEVSRKKIAAELAASQKEINDAKEELQKKAKAKKAADRKRAAAPDKAKLNHLAQILEEFNEWPKLSTKEAKEILLQTKLYINDAAQYLLEEIKEL